MLNPSSWTFSKNAVFHLLILVLSAEDWTLSFTNARQVLCPWTVPWLELLCFKTKRVLYDSSETLQWGCRKSSPGPNWSIASQPLSLLDKMGHYVLPWPSLPIYFFLLSYCYGLSGVFPSWGCLLARSGRLHLQACWLLWWKKALMMGPAADPSPIDRPPLHNRLSSPASCRGIERAAMVRVSQPVINNVFIGDSDKPVVLEESLLRSVYK